jgi:serine phosphatase RsbU (regulator of sigma subunit)
VSGGQGPILVYRAATGKMDRFDATGLPMGILRDVEFEPAEPIDLAPGDIFVLLTDGFIEWSGPTGELYGEERLEAAVHANRHLSCRELIQAIYTDVLRFAEGSPQLDDLTAVLIKRL